MSVPVVPGVVPTAMLPPNGVDPAVTAAPAPNPLAIVGRASNFSVDPMVFAKFRNSAQPSLMLRFSGAPVTFDWKNVAAVILPVDVNDPVEEITVGLER